MRVLLITNDGEEFSRIQAAMEGQDFTLDRVRGPRQGACQGRDGRYGAILVGHLEDKAAVKAVIGDLRQSGVDQPVMVLRVAAGNDEVVELLDAGADECLTGPYDSAVLMARLRALVRRCEPGEGTVLRFEDLALDLASHRVEREGKPIRLTPKELALLECFMRSRDRVLSRAQLSEAVWDSPLDPESNVIDVFISKLRQKIDKPFDTRYLHTLVGSGYMLSATAPGA